MRKRSTTIFAESKEDYIEMMSQIDTQLNEGNNRSYVKKEKNKTKSKLSEIFEDKLDFDENVNSYEEYFDFLSLSNEFHLQLKEPNFQDMEKLEEDKLIENIENMNKSFRNNNKAEFLSAVAELYSTNNVNINIESDTVENNINTNSISSTFFRKLGSKRSYSFDTIDNIEKVGIECNQVKKNKNMKLPAFKNSVYFNENNLDNNSLTNDKNSLLSNSSTNYSSTGSIGTNFENLIKQNLNVFEDVVKLMVVGDKAVGKSLLINKLCTDNNFNGEYIPTKTLEIKRCVFQNTNKLIKIELWDTNIGILNSNIIKTYFKLCNGFVLICDITNFDSILYMEKLIENIIDFSNSDPLIIYANIRNDINVEDYYTNLNHIKSIEEKYSIKVNFLDLSDYTIQKDFNFQKFINNCLIKKSISNSAKGNNKSIGSGNKNFSRVKKYVNIEPKNLNTKFLNTQSEHTIIRDMSASPKKTKENCIIY